MTLKIDMNAFYAYKSEHKQEKKNHNNTMNSYVCSLNI